MNNNTVETGKSAKIIFYIIVVFLSINTAFVFTHWYTDSQVPKELVKKRVKDAFRSGALVESVQLHRHVKHGSPVNHIGIDQYTECANALMLIYPSEEALLKNAIVPGLQTRADKGVLCRDLNKLARDKLDLEKTVTRTKARLWHGAKPVTAALLPKFEFYQIANLIRQLSHFGLALLLGYAFYHSKAAGLALIPVSVVAMVGSGLNLYGGIPNALPYTVALFSALFVAWVQSRFTFRKAIYAAVATGSLMAFIYILDGSLILVLSLLLFLLYFTQPKLSRISRWRNTLILCTAFVLSFFLSFAFKQLISIPVLGAEQVWGELTEFLGIRLGTAQGGQIRSHWHAFVDQVGRYDLATSWNMFLRDAIVYGGNLSWIAAIGLAAAISIKFKTWAAVSDSIIFALIAFVVFFRYTVMTAHSYMHWYIVGRYVFVFFAFGMSMLIWMILLYKRMNSNGDGGAAAV